MAEDYTSLLGRLGFSEYEAKAYLALLRHGPSTGYQVAKNSGVPRSRVYDILGKLTTRGAVVVEPGATSDWKAVGPEELLSGMERNYRETVDVLREGLKQQVHAPEVEKIQLYSGYGPVLDKTRQIISESAELLYMTLHPEELAILREDLLRAGERGVALRLMLMGPAEFPLPITIVHDHTEAHSRRHGGPQLLCVQDNRAALLATIVREEPEQSRGTYVNNALIIGVTAEYIRHDMGYVLCVGKVGPDGTLPLETRKTLDQLRRDSSGE